MKSNIEFRSTKNSNATNAWRIILKNWIKVNKKYSKDCEDDYAYYYNERASLSILSAAVWLSNGIAIEEYVSEKKIKNRKYSGRVDLWFKLNDYNCVVEAKQVNQRILHRNLNNIAETINFKLNEAVKDASKSLHIENNGFAVVFFTPSILVSKPVEFDLIYEQVRNSEYDFIAYIRGNESNYFDNIDKPIRYYPAGFIIGKEILAKKAR